MKPFNTYSYTQAKWSVLDKTSYACSTYSVYLNQFEELSIKFNLNRKHFLYV